MRGGRVWSRLGLLVIHVNLRIDFSISAKKALRILKEVTANLQVALDSGVIPTRVLGATDTGCLFLGSGLHYCLSPVFCGFWGARLPILKLLLDASLEI